MSNTKRMDTGRALLPALATVKLDDPQLSNWVKAVTERLQVREGERGNEAERAVTLRELRAMTGHLDGITQLLKDGKEAGPGEMVIDLGGGMSVSARVDSFARSIIESPLFKDLARTLDDPERFNHLAMEIRTELLRSITDEAAKRGAEVRDLQMVVQNNERSFAMAIREVTASVQQASAGLRATQAAWSDGTKAMATNVLQLQASLGKYYQDGRPGRASLEQEMTVQASYAKGLRAQYTLKVQAGGALAGYGIAAEDVNGRTTSAFIIMADKFAIVSPSYSGGQMSTPRPQDVVFGVDDDGTYLQRSVYLKGNLRVDGLGRTLNDGMRGSLALAGGSGSWSDATARQRVWSALGNSGTAPNNNHLQVGDSVTIGTQTRHWIGTAWVVPGAVFSGDVLVDGTVAARKVDTRGLTVRDDAGNIILSANGMDATWLRNLRAQQVQGLGPMATQDSARIGSTVKFPDGSVMNTWDFISRLQRINTGNISTFMDHAAIGTAFIGNAAIGTLQVAGGAITSMAYGQSGAFSVGPGSSAYGASLYMHLPANSSGVVLVAGCEVEAVGGDASVGMYIVRNGQRIGFSSSSIRGGWTAQLMVMAFDAPWSEGGYSYSVEVFSPTSGPGSNKALSVARSYITGTGGKR